MNWRVDFSENSLKFLKKNNLKEDFIIERIKLALRKFKGENININIKRLKGEWEERDTEEAIRVFNKEKKEAY